MKKFIFGFILGAIFFGSIGVAAAVMEDTIKIKWDIDAIYIDGKKVTMKKKNPAFTYNGVAYIPSYVLSDMDYSPSRTPDGKTILLKSKGPEIYPSSVQSADDDVKRIIPSSDISTRAKLTFNVNSTEPLVVNDKAYENFVHVKFNEKSPSTNASSTFTFNLNEEYRRFSMTGRLIGIEAEQNNEPVVLRVYITNSKKQVVLYNTYTFNEKQKSMNIEIPLRGAQAIEFELSNTSENVQEFVMLNAAFIK